MSVQYVHSKPGYEFRPTYFGKRNGAIAAKYEDSYPSRTYRTCVPKRWLTENFVEEVPIKNA